MKRILALVAALGAISMAGSAMAATNTLSVTATVIGTCRFSSPTSTLGFGNLDPSLATDATATALTSFWCTKGAAYSIADNGGANLLGAQARMVHATDPASFVPYAISYPNAGTGAGKGTPSSLTITGTVLNADYINATAGSYSDTVVLTITP